MTGGNLKTGHRESESECKEGGVPYSVLGVWGTGSVDNYKNEGEASQTGEDQSDLRKNSRRKKALRIRQGLDLRA